MKKMGFVLLKGMGNFDKTKVVRFTIPEGERFYNATQSLEEPWWDDQTRSTMVGDIYAEVDRTTGRITFQEVAPVGYTYYDETNAPTWALEALANDFREMLRTVDGMLTVVP